jgi:hypothetical protein
MLLRKILILHVGSMCYRESATRDLDFNCFQVPGMMP